MLTVVSKNFIVWLIVFLIHFKDIPCDVKVKLLDSYCLDVYGSQLWIYSKHDVDMFFIAWRKSIQRLWKIPNTTHCNLLSSINSSVPIVINLKRRCAKFIWSCLNRYNSIVKTIVNSAKCSSVQNFGDNYRYLSYKYKIGNHVWDSPLSIHRYVFTVIINVLIHICLIILQFFQRVLLYVICV